MRSITIGRSNKCDIIVPDNNVSRIHAEISRNGREFIFHDMSKNGSNIGGRMIHNERIAIASGTPVLLAHRIPLPWAQVYAMLPGPGNVPSGQMLQTGTFHRESHHARADRLGVGWGILAFIIPIAGWIMYFIWKDETPKRASLAGILGTVSFAINLLNILTL